MEKKQHFKSKISIPVKEEQERRISDRLQEDTNNVVCLEKNSGEECEQRKNKRGDYGVKRTAYYWSTVYGATHWPLVRLNQGYVM